MGPLMPKTAVSSTRPGTGSGTSCLRRDGFSADILLSTFDGARFVREFMMSLANQTCGGFRLLVRDDGSGDGTPGIVVAAAAEAGIATELLPSSGEHRGVAASFGELLGRSSAPYVFFADQDDVWHPDKVETMLDVMRSAEKLYGSSTPLLLHSDLRVIDAGGGPVADSFVRYMQLLPRRRRTADLVVQNNVTGCAMMINAPLRDRVRQPLPPEAVCHDWYLALLASAFGRIVFFDRPLTDYRNHGSNVFGAKRNSMISLLRAGRGRLRERLTATRCQAGAFLRQYGDDLSASDRAAVGAWAGMEDLSKAAKILTCLRFGFRKNTAAQNMGMWWAL